MSPDIIAKFTYLDIAVVLIIIAFAVINARKGIAGALLKFMPTLLGVLLSWKMSGVVIKYIRNTSLFPFLMGKIENGINLENILPDMTMSAQNSIISNMNIPEFIKNALVSNNNSVVYNIFDANTLNEYVSGFITNILISVGVVIALYLIGIIVGKVVLKFFDIVNDVPVLGAFSKAGGLVVGIIKAVCVIWVIGIAITFFCCKPWAQDFMTLLETSYIAGWFYKNNILLYVVLQIMA